MSPSDIQQIYTDPEEILEIYDLVYSTPSILSILRLRNGDAFEYASEKNGGLSKSDLERIEGLVIPPAWQDVRIATLGNAHLQAIGRDSKKRKQYKYHPVWLRVRNQTKFYKMALFAQSLPKIRTRVESDLRLKTWQKDKVLALVIRLLEESHIRIGNDYYARKNGTYGLSTLRSRHVEIAKDRIRFHFVGKRGKEHEVTIRDKRLARLVNRCEEIPGWELFKFFDEHGEKHRIDSGMVNAYIQQICGELFSAKDFRTWGASVIAFDTLAKGTYPEETADREQRVLEAVDTAADALNNTRSVCRKYYIHPVIPESYLDGSIEPYLKKATGAGDPRGSTDLQNNERALLELIEANQPDFGIKNEGS